MKKGLSYGLIIYRVGNYVDIVSNVACWCGDMFKFHLTTNTKKLLAKINTDVAVIPGGLKALVQPFDVHLTKLFKDHIQEQWNKWMVGLGVGSHTGYCNSLSKTTAPTHEVL